MALITHDRPAAAGIFAHVSDLAEAWARWRLYRRTLRELHALGDADLADIGLTRSGLVRVAHEAVYGR